ncbi:MAG: transcription termination factor Rho, partial [Kiritimatiellae bacterium]|nr:transcription termination factor Rho [Kiritimatiellia bacterium]
MAGKESAALIMADEFDVFANSKSAAGGGKEQPPARPAPAKSAKRVHHKNHARQAKANNSPIRGANGEESVNPLLNAPLPSEQRAEQNQEAPANPNRNPELPEFRLADIQTWPAPAIVEKMMPGADPEELGSYRKHELIFAAIRAYIARGGAVLASGCLEIVREGHGFLRSAKNNFLACPEDVFVTQQQIRRHALRTGDIIEGPIRDPRDRDRFFCLGNVNRVNGKEPSVAARVVHFENLTATFPTRRIILETEAKEYSTRVIDLFSPIGFGQRGLIIAPPRVGKTVLLQKMANAISANHPEAMLIILLIDERPEEVTDMQRNTRAMVLSSTFDEEPQHHVNVAEMVIEMSKRQVENGRDVIILLDSITRMARAYNTVQPHSGKILTGGV